MQQIFATLTAEARAFFHHALRDWGGRTMLAVGAYVLLFFAWQLFGWGGPAHQDLISDLAFLPVSLAAGAVTLRAAARPGLTPAARRGWRLIGCSFLLYWVGDLLWFYYEIIRQVSPFPSIADVFYLAQYPVLLLGILTLPAGKGGPVEVARFWLDAVTVLISGWTVTWYLVIGPAAATEAGQLAALLSVAYPVGDLLVFFGIVVILLRHRSLGAVGPRTVLALGLLLIFVGDLAHGRLTLTDQYQSGDWPDAFWLAGQYATLVAGQLRFYRAPGAALTTPANLRMQGWMSLAMPYLAVLLTFGVLVFGGEYNATTDILVHGAVAVTLAVMVRQVLVLLDNRRLLHSRAHLMKELRHLAYHDSLTDLPNRSLLREKADLALEVKGRPVALLFIDLDGFKTVNDSLGHLAGDELLRLIARRLTGCLRLEDTVARLGGDEFAILLPGADEETAVQVTDRVTGALSRPFPVAGHEVYVYASIGIAISQPGAAVTADDLLRNADVAMYSAKGLGQGRHALFHPSMHEAAMRRLELEAELRAAIDERQFFLHYQPVVQLGTGQIVGVEALVRWQHPRRGVLAPGEFIPVCEETGLIVPLGNFVLEEACAQVARWQRAYPGEAPITLSVNLSPRQLLLGHELVADVARALAESSLAPGSLALEITESVFVNSTPATSETMIALKALGVRLAIDDFGTGYSSLSYLSGFPIDSVKIDRTFIGAVGRGRRETALLRGIVELSNALGLIAVAEGIERPEQVAELEGLGCALGQGFYFARPGTAEQVARRLAEGWEQDHVLVAKNDAEGLPL